MLGVGLRRSSGTRQSREFLGRGNLIRNHGIGYLVSTLLQHTCETTKVIDLSSKTLSWIILPRPQLNNRAEFDSSE